jgi:Cohesin domain
MRQGRGITSTVAGVIRHHTSWAAAVAFALLSLAFAAGQGAALATHSSSTIGLLAIDANPEGNTATSLGPINGCSRVETGAELNVDYVVDSIPQDRPMIAFEAEIRYDPQLLEVVAVDNEFLLGAVGDYRPVAGLTDKLPDSDGKFRLSVLDAASTTDPEANVERGTGVLARITVSAKAAGVSEVGIGVQQEPALYPYVQDTKNESILAERAGSISLAVGQDCSPQAAEPKITDLAEVNAQILGATPDPQATPTPDGGSASPPDDAATEGETPTPVPVTTPCVVTAGRTISPSTAPPDASLSPSPSSPPDGAQGPESPSSTLAATPAPSPASADVLCTPTPAPLQDDIVDVEEDSDTLLIAGAAALLALGSAAGGGGWYLHQRSRKRSPAG